MNYIYLGSYLGKIICTFTQRTISVAAINWQPYTGETLPSYGFHSEITIEAFKRVGYEVEVSFHPWARALDMAMNGKVDCLLTVYHTDEREDTLYFSDTVTTANVVLWKRVDSDIPDSINSLHNLKDFRIVYLRGGSVTPEFTGKFIPVNPPLRTRRVFNVFPKSVSDSSKIVEDFNRGLQMLKDDGTFDLIIKKHGQ